MKVWEGFYDEGFARRALVHPRSAELDFLVDQLGVEPGARLFDQCCGPGRVAVPLALRGFVVHGVDLMPDYIAEAYRRAPGEARDRLHLQAGDAGQFQLAEPAAGGFNLYSSFGYSQEDADNLAVLRCAAASLRNGARFILDTHNVARLLADFQPLLTTHYEDGVELVRESRLDLAAGMLRQDWTYHFPDGTIQRRRGDCKLYMASHLASLCAQAGLKVLECFGDFSGEGLERLSPRLILVAGRL